MCSPTRSASIPGRQLVWKSNSTAKVAPYVRARVWHTSQQMRERPDGTLVLAMNVCHDWALRSWILSWGPFARVLTPAALAKELRSDLQAASERYMSGLT